MAKSTKSTYKPAKKGNYKPVVRMAGGGNVSELNYSERREYIEENYAPFITDAQMIFSIWDSGIEYDYKADRKEVVSSIIDSYRELGDYTEMTLPQETIYEIQDWDLVRREIDPETDEVIGETPLEELSADNTYNFSYNGLVDLNWRVYHDVDYDRFFYVIMPHLGGDIRGNYGDAIILEGNDKDELFYRFYEGFISGGASIYIKFKDGSEIGFDSEQDSDSFSFRLNEVFEPTGMALKYLEDYEKLDSYTGDEFLEETIDIYLARKGVAPKMMAGGSLNDETPMAYIQILGYDEGKWFNLTDYADGQDVIDGIYDWMNGLNQQFGGNREEYEVTDYEGFGDDLYDEYMGANEFEEIIEAYEKYESSDFPADVISAYKKDSGSRNDSLSDVIDEMENNYFGKYDNLTDFGYEMVQQGVYEPSDNDVYITDTDKRIIAGEESDSLVNDMSFEDLMNIAPDTQSEYDDEKSELEDKIVEIQEEIKDLTSLLNDAEDDDEYERISDEIESKEIDLEDAENSYVDIDSRFEDKAREEARDSIYDEIYDKLENDLSSWLEEYGYTSELQNLSFLSVDYENIGDYLSSDYLIVEYDGEMYFFNNYAKGGRITASKRKPKYAFYIVESSTKKLVSGYSTKAEATEQRKLLVQQYPSMRFEIYPLANLEAKTDLDVYAKKDYVELSTLDKIKKVSVDAYRYGQEKVGQAQVFLEKNDVKGKIKRGARKVADKTKQGFNWLRNKWLEADFGDGTGRAKFFADGGIVGEIYGEKDGGNKIDIYYKTSKGEHHYLISTTSSKTIKEAVEKYKNILAGDSQTSFAERKRINRLEGKFADGGYPTKLNIGSIIQGVGFTMLKGLEGGKFYKIVDKDGYSATLVESDENGKIKKNKKLVRHYLDSLEGGISSVEKENENGFLVVKYADGGEIKASDLLNWDKKLDEGEDVVVYDNNGVKYIYQGSSYEKDSVAVMKGFDESTYRMMPLTEIKSIEIGSLYADGGELYDMYLPMGFYVKINPYYTATIRNLNSFESYLERKDEIWGKEFGEITNVDKSASKEWVAELNRLIAKKKSELETYGTGKYKVGDEITIWRNQADRDGYVIAVHNNEILVEYEMPNGTTALNIIDLTLPEYDKYNYRKNYTPISYEKARLSKKWGNKIDASRLINNPQGSAKRFADGGEFVDGAKFKVILKSDKHYGQVGFAHYGIEEDNRGVLFVSLEFPNGVNTYSMDEVERVYANGGMAGLGEVSGMLPSPLPMSTITPMARGGKLEDWKKGKFINGKKWYLYKYDNKRWVLEIYQKDNLIDSYYIDVEELENQETGIGKKMYISYSNSQGSGILIPEIVQVKVFNVIKMDNPKLYFGENVYDYQIAHNKFSDEFGYANGGSVQSEIVYLDNRIYNLEELVERINEDEKPEMYATINKLKKEREHLIKRGNNPEEVKPKKSFFGLFAKGGEMKLPKDNSRVHFKDDQNKEHDGIFVAEGNGNPSMFLIGFGQGASDFRFVMEVVDWHYLDKKHNHDAHAKHEASETAEEEKAEHEYDVYDNKRMLENQANEIEHHSEELSEQVKKTKKVPAWVIAKMERATTDLSDITHYLDGENKMAYGGSVGGERYDVVPFGNKFVVVRLSKQTGSKKGVIIREFNGDVMKFDDINSAKNFIKNIEPKYPYGIPKANAGMILLASQLLQQQQQQQQQQQPQPQVVYYVPQPQEPQNTGIVQNIPEMASGGEVEYDNELINDFCITNLIELANELQSVKYYVTHRFKETDFESKKYKGRLVIVFKEPASVNVIETITKFIERAEDCHHLFEQSVNVSGSEPNSISINLLSDKFSDLEFGKGGKVYDYAPKKINIAKTKKIKTHLGNYVLGLITNDFVYFVNSEEGDDNANTMMYNKNGELLSDNIHATNDLFETLESQSKFEFIHPDLEKYRQEILKGN